MKKHSLVPNKGLNLSQAQSISNLCHQRASEINNQLEMINNYSKIINVDGENLTLKKGHKMPDNIIELLKEKSELHACQAFLMENIQAKDKLLSETRFSEADISQINKPEEPKLKTPTLIEGVDENYGWSKLNISEINEFYEAEAYASHIGQFIHKNSKLSNLRNELPNLPNIEWFEVDKDKKTPVKIHTHHTSDYLLSIHEELAYLHRKYEQRVNYFKAKVKNITTQKNIEIAKYNAEIQSNYNKTNNDLINEYKSEMNIYEEKIQLIRKEFEKTKQEKISTIASMRILVDDRFKKIVDLFMTELQENK